MSSDQIEIPCVLMRGGTSKGLYFLSDDLPEELALRDRVLLAVMGSPDQRQIDGVGGGHPLTSKVAIVKSSDSPAADVDYLFLQVKVDEAIVSDSQNCGNILAGVGPFAIEKGLVKAQEGETEISIRMLNSGSIALARVQTPNKQVAYHGNTIIDGVPGSAAPISLDFKDSAGANCGALLPTGNPLDIVDGIEVTCIDNGMPVVIIEASQVSKTGYESPHDLESDIGLKKCIEMIRIRLGQKMNLGDVTNKTVPKMVLVAPAENGGVISTRSFIPHKVHEAIGVLGATSVAAACLIEGTVANKVSRATFSQNKNVLSIEHPSGAFTVEMQISAIENGTKILRSGLIRTTRKLMQGSVFVPAFLFNK